MKIIFTLLLVMLCLLGCQHASTSAPSASPALDISPSSPNDISQGRRTPPSFATKTDYEEYVASQKVFYEDCIHYETISLCGEFNGFSDSGKYSTVKGYTYYLNDSNNFSYGLDIVHGTTIGLDMGVLEFDDNPADLRFHRNDSGYYYVGNIRYAYYEGKLYNIRWSIGEKTALIQAAGGQLHTYPLGGNTFMSRLLNAETAEAVAAEFNAKVAQARAEKAG